jgi:hypothetical protein
LFVDATLSRGWSFLAIWFMKVFKKRRE